MKLLEHEITDVRNMLTDLPMAVEDRIVEANCNKCDTRGDAHAIVETFDSMQMGRQDVANLVENIGQIYLKALAR